MVFDTLLRIYQFIVVRWMKLKAKVTNAMEYYVATMEKGFVRKPEAIISGNKKEYVSKKLKKLYLANRG